MRFSTQQTFVLGSALLVLPALAAPVPNPTTDAALPVPEILTVARDLDMRSVEERGLGTFLHSVGSGIKKAWKGKGGDKHNVNSMPPPPPADSMGMVDPAMGGAPPMGGAPY